MTVVGLVLAYVAQAGLELMAVLLRQSLNARITGMHSHAWLDFLILLPAWKLIPLKRSLLVAWGSARTEVQMARIQVFNLGVVIVSTGCVVIAVCIITSHL